MRNRRLLNRVVGFPVFLLFIVLSSCLKEGPQNPDDLDAVVTRYDTTFNFAAVGYYLMPDTVTVVNADSTYQKTQTEIDYERNILDQIALEMQQKGYSRLTLSDTSNQELMNNAVMLTVSRSTENYQSSYYYDYYSGYGGYNYYNPGYSYGYSYPWSYPVNYSYTVGTVVIRMFDPTEPAGTNEQLGSVNYPVRWMAVLNGILSSGQSSINERIINSVTQAFNQSPYL